MTVSFHFYNSGVGYKSMFNSNSLLNPSCEDIDSIQFMIVFLSSDGVLWFQSSHGVDCGSPE